MEMWAEVHDALEDVGVSPVESVELIRDSPGRPVWRVSVGGGDSLVVKHVTSGDEDQWRLVERDGQALRVAAGCGVTPELVVLDPARKVMAQTDLGAGQSLADALLGSDALVAETSLVRYAESLARLHTATIGTDVAPGGLLRTSVADSFAKIGPVLDSLGVAASPGCVTEVEALVARLAEPGHFGSLIHGDACPDNTLIGDDGTVHFFDFEYGGSGHALLDLAFLYLPFPTCWCVGRIPESSVRAAEIAYRTQRPELASDGVFLTGLADVMAAAAIVTVAWHLDAITGEDKPWGTASLRQRPAVRLAAFSKVARRADRYPALAEFADAVTDRLAAIWPNMEPLDLYAAFGGRSFVPPAARTDGQTT